MKTSLKGVSFLSQFSKASRVSTIPTEKMWELCNIWLPINGILNSCLNLEDSFILSITIETLQWINLKGFVHNAASGDFSWRTTVSFSKAPTFYNGSGGLLYEKWVSHCTMLCVVPVHIVKRWLQCHASAILGQLPPSWSEFPPSCGRMIRVPRVTIFINPS